MRRKQEREWGPYDAAVWNTLAMLTHIDAERFDSLPDHPVSFARQNHPERILAAGTYDLLEWTAPGDGSYIHDSSQLIAWGRGGMPLMAAHTIGRSIGNSRRRAAAAQAAVNRWLRIDTGTLHVSTRGFYLSSTQGHHAWTWDAIDDCSMVAAGLVRFHGRSARGPVHWQIGSDWAELVFNVWGRVRNPTHPQLADGSWISPYWAPFATAQGHPLPVGASRILPSI